MLFIWKELDSILRRFSKKEKWTFTFFFFKANGISLYSQIMVTLLLSPQCESGSAALIHIFYFIYRAVALNFGRQYKLKWRSGEVEIIPKLSSLQLGSLFQYWIIWLLEDWFGLDSNFGPGKEPRPSYTMELNLETWAKMPKCEAHYHSSLWKFPMYNSETCRINYCFFSAHFSCSRDRSGSDMAIFIYIYMIRIWKYDPNLIPIRRIYQFYLLYLIQPDFLNLSI